MVRQKYQNKQQQELTATAKLTVAMARIKCFVMPPMLEKPTCLAMKK
ncbi:MAG: hypothetical protein NTV46_21500 [Verrucomicrobia bacterium]|nr:hypothetical protein [Verrucomicrobiota bacterium]